MLIKYYGYNSFIIQSGKIKIMIDPGGSFYLPHFFRSVIPKHEWPDVTHIIVTHGDPDHHWHTDRVQKKSGAVIICNQEMVKNVNGKILMLGPRNKGVAYTTPVEKLLTLKAGEMLDLHELKITGFQGNHGPFEAKIGPVPIQLKPGPDERIGLGAMVFQIELNGKKLVNFGDTLLLENEWRAIKQPDLIMIPVGGYTTMNPEEAVKLIEFIKPGVVIPCHYNCPAFFSKCGNYVDIDTFANNCANIGAECVPLKAGDAYHLA